MPEAPKPQDSRSYFMLPQAPEEAGYYVYGTLRGMHGMGHLAQYAHPYLLTLIFKIEWEWKTIEERKFGIGNISIDGGLPYDKHKSHQKGIEMDCRPIRKDELIGQAARVSRFDKVYDQDATIKLIRLFVQHPMVKVVFFHDDKVQQALGSRVRSLKGHDDHFHVAILESP